MGEALIVRRGGGASLNGVALIWCEFPVEATSVTCSNGVKTYSVPTKWLSSGGYCFSVDAEGPWILTANNANYNDISTIEIQTNNIYKVFLTFRTYLFKEELGITNGYTIKSIYPKGDFTQKNSLIWANTNENNTGNIFQFQPSINLIDYETLSCELKCTSRYNTSQTAVKIVITEAFRTGESQSTWETLKKFATIDDPYNTNRHIVTLDITSVTNNACITIYGFGMSGEVYNVWLK